MKPFWFPAGDSALLLDFQGFKPTKKNYFAKDEEKIYYSNKVNLISSHLQNLLNKNKLHGITEIVPGIASILIHYDLSLVSYHDVKNKIELHINNSKNIIKSKQRLWRIPVLYGGIHGFEKFIHNIKSDRRKFNKNSYIKKIANHNNGFSSWFRLYVRIR